jgi:hypothetical protein
MDRALPSGVRGPVLLPPKTDSRAAHPGSRSSTQGSLQQHQRHSVGKEAKGQGVEADIVKLPNR